MATVGVEEVPFCGTRLATSDIGGCKFGGAEPRFDTDARRTIFSRARDTSISPYCYVTLVPSFCLRILSIHDTKAPWKVDVS